MKEPLEPGTIVEKIDSLPGDLVQDGRRGVVVSAHGPFFGISDATLHKPIVTRLSDLRQLLQDLHLFIVDRVNDSRLYCEVIEQAMQGIQGPEVLDPIKIERATLTASYKRECQQAGVKVTDVMIAAAANHKWHDRTPVTLWKRVDPRSTPAADKMIRAVFQKKPHLRAFAVR